MANAKFVKWECGCVGIVFFHEEGTDIDWRESWVLTPCDEGADAFSNDYVCFRRESNDTKAWTPLGGVERTKLLKRLRFMLQEDGEAPLMTDPVKGQQPCQNTF